MQIHCVLCAMPELYDWSCRLATRTAVQSLGMIRWHIHQSMTQQEFQAPQCSCIAAMTFLHTMGNCCKWISEGPADKGLLLSGLPQVRGQSVKALLCQPVSFMLAVAFASSNVGWCTTSHQRGMMHNPFSEGNLRAELASMLMYSFGLTRSAPDNACQ